MPPFSPLLSRKQLTPPSSVDSTAHPPPYTPPTHPGPLPSPQSIPDNQGTLYHGSCHCGAVTAALKVDHPFESQSYKGMLAECNCSHCIRVGPPRSPLANPSDSPLNRAATSGPTQQKTSLSFPGGKTSPGMNSTKRLSAKDRVNTAGCWFLPSRCLSRKWRRFQRR